MQPHPESNLEVRRRAPVVSAVLVHRNSVLAELSAAARERLWPELRVVHLAGGDSLDEREGARHRVYFPLGAVVSVQRRTKDGAGPQVAIIGSEGVIAPGLLWHSDAHGFVTTVQVAGPALVMDSRVLLYELALGGSAVESMVQQLRKLLNQMSQLALCNRHHSVEQQLARWLLMMRDRIGSNDVTATQAQVAEMLGVRREGISEAVSRLREAGLLSGRRGHFIVEDVAGLRARSCECYELLRSGDEPLPLPAQATPPLPRAPQELLPEGVQLSATPASRLTVRW